MHDLRLIREDPHEFDRSLVRRGVEPMSVSILQLDEQLRRAIAVSQTSQNRRKHMAREIEQKKKLGKQSTALESEAQALRASLEEQEKTVTILREKLQKVLSEIPNRLDITVPDGKDENDNVIICEYGLRKDFSFIPKQHFELGEALGQMDFTTAAKLSGARFVILTHQLARMERALAQFMVDTHVMEHGYTEVSVPLLVNDATMYGTDKLPKFADQSFRTEDGRWLIPTAEVPLTASVANDILMESDLPRRLVALSHCFRSEAGSAGRDVRGMLRQHQFQKVELVSITTPEESDAEHERMTECAEAILKKLEVPFRRVLLCAGDTGFGSAKTYDLEAWLPGQQAWRELSSCSTTRDFQARRMNSRFRSNIGSSPRFVHTLNGSGVAVGRMLIAVIENYQNDDGSLTIPDVLCPYMDGQVKISKNESL